MNAITQTAPQAAAVTGAFKVDTARGGHDGTVSSEWFRRPADQRFLSLADLEASVQARAAASAQKVIDLDTINIRAENNDLETLRVGFTAEGKENVLLPTHHSFSQLCGLTSTPAGFMRELPAPLVAINLGYRIKTARQENVKLYYGKEDSRLYAATGADYGRIFDHEIVSAVRKIAGNGTGDTNWKIPGMLDWSTSMYNPFVDPTVDTTTLYASDRDVFIFLVDDTHPIEIGKLKNGDPDYVFRGFYISNSEMGGKTLKFRGFLLRGVCQNRNLWGVEADSLAIRHTKLAPQRFAREMEPHLIEYANASPAPIVASIQAAKEAVVAHNDEEREAFLKKHEIAKSRSAVDAILTAVLNEEGKAAESVWDFVNGITAVARGIKNQDARVELELKAGALMKKVAA